MGVPVDLKPAIVDSGYIHLETMLKQRSDNLVLYQSPNYDKNIEAWMAFGSDNDQCTLLEQLAQMALY